MQQHIAPRRDVLRLRTLNLVVADAVLARSDDHPRWCPPRHVHRVMPCTGHSRHVAVTQLLRSLGHYGEDVSVYGFAQRVRRIALAICGLKKAASCHIRL